ncbi:hypothetical protein Tco_0718336 [Tanacetum coccineum]
MTPQKWLSPPVVCDRKQRKRKENAAAAVDLTPHTEHPRHGSLPKCLFRGVKSLHDTVRCKAQVEESSLETLSMDELITQLRKMCKDAEDRASNAQEEVRQKRKEALEEVV